MDNGDGYRYLDPMKCACGCGEELPGRPGTVELFGNRVPHGNRGYLNHAHRQRAYRARNRPRPVPSSRDAAPELGETDRPVVLSLCDYSGSWSEPYERAGYDVRRVDLQLGGDVRAMPHVGTPVRGILAAPPCERFTRLSAPSWSRDPEPLEALAVVDACLRAVALYDPAWWALENPPGRLSKWLGPPSWSFQPYQFGHPWTKLTQLWGRFTEPEPGELVQPVGSLVDLVHEARARSVTPSGFAAAFALANP